MYIFSYTNVYILSKIKGVIKMQMQGTISQWGNGKAVRIPKKYLDFLGLEENDAVEISLSENTIMIKPTEHKPKSLKELFQGYEGDYKCTEWDTGVPVGREIL